MFFRRLLLYWLPVILWASFIYYLSAQPDLRIVPDNIWDFILRKAAHMFVYAVLFLLVVRAFGKKHLAFAFLLTLLYAVSDEYHQTKVPTRHGDPMDLLIDTTGIIIAFVVWKYEQSRHSKPRN